MKNISLLYSSDNEFEKLISANELSAEKEYLIRIHTSVHTSDTIMEFVDRILSYLPASKIIGSSTSGVIYKGEILTDCCLVSVTEFENSFVETGFAGINDENSIETAAQLTAVVSDKTRFLFTFAARHFLTIDEFAERLNDMAPGVQIIGGVANTPASPLIFESESSSFVFTEKGVYCNSVVCAAVSSEKLSVYSDVIYVTEPVGDLHTITKTDGNIIRSIDGISAVKWYEDMLGVRFDELDDPLSTTILFPLVRAEHGNIPWPLTYSPQNEELSPFQNEPDPILVVNTIAKPGDVIRLSFSSVQKTVDVCEMVCDNLNNHSAEVLFGYSCVSRQDIFSNCAKWELMPFRKTNLCGALVAGEFGCIDGINRYCCFSFTIAALAENNGKIKINTEVLSEHSDELINSNESIIRYLIEHENSDNAIAKQHEIEKTLFIDSETGLGNLTKFLFDFNIGKFNKICMISIKNESLIKAFLSESKFFLYFNRFIKYIIDFIADKRFSYYTYKETSLIITAEK